MVNIIMLQPIMLCYGLTRYEFFLINDRLSIFPSMINTNLISPVTRTIIGTFILITFLCSCHYNSTYNNREEDKIEGEKVIENFYHLLKNEDYSLTYKLYSPRFFEVTDTQKLQNFYKITLDSFGSIDNFQIANWQTQKVVGTDTKTDYLFICKVNRSNASCKESIALTKENGEIKITGYHVKKYEYGMK